MTPTKSAASRQSARRAKPNRRSPRLPKPVGASPAPPASASAQPFLRNKTNGAAGNTPNEKSSASPAASAPVPPKPLDLSKERTITVKEAAFRLRKSADAVRYWLRTGRLRGWQPGGRCCAVVVSEASLEEALLRRVGVGGAA